MSVEGKDRCDVLLKLADFRMTRIANRREHEWKVTVALWALLAAGIAKPPAISFTGLLIVLVVIWLGHWFLWIRSHGWVSKEDTYYSFLYTDEVQQRLNLDIRHKAPEQPTNWGFFKEGRCWAQTATTAILAACIALRVCHQGA
jgi:hypothetical protein